MQCQRSARRAVCRASKTYNASLALRAAFGCTTTRYRDDKVRTPSVWEPTEWEELPRGQQEEQQHTDQHERSSSLASEPSQSKVAKKRRKRATSLSNDDESGKGDRAVEVPLTKEKIPLLDNMRYSLIAQAKKLVQARRPQEAADMSEHRYWQATTSGRQIIDAETWKPGIGDLVSLNRELRKHELSKHELDASDRALMKAAFDYLPYAVMPRAPAHLWALDPPWERPSPAASASCFEMELSKEMARFAAFMRPNELERVARKVAMEEVLALVRGVPALGTPTSVEIHGSQTTGLAMPTSDIDVRVWVESAASNKGNNRFAYAQVMRGRMSAIYNALRSDHERFNLVTMRNGMHPIINFQHVPSGIDVQIVSTPSSRPQQDVTRSYLAKFPGLHDLFIVIRTALEVRGLLPVHNGGTGAYGCFVMLLPPLLRVLSDANPEMSTAQMLREFLKFYDPCDTINPARYGVACHPRQVFLKHKADASIGNFARLARLRGDQIRAEQWRMCQIKEYQPYLLTLQDPANPGNDLGARIHAIKHIIATFKMLRLAWDSSRSESVECGTYQPLLCTIVGRPDLLYKKQRQTLENYGRDALKNGFVPNATEESENLATGSLNARISY